jgi:hypothetical protein
MEEQIMNRRKAGIVLPVIAMALLLTTSASAAILAPGGTVIATPFSGSPGTLLASVTSPFVSVLGPGDFNGNATEAVYLDSVTGNLDFLYQWSNSSTSGFPIEASTDGNYSGFITDIYSQLGGPAFGPFSASGTVAATAIARSANGANVSFLFPIPNAVQPGETTAIRMIKTNATSFGPGTFSVINQGTATLTNFFAPVSDTPEPGTVTLLVGALGVIALGRRRRRA